MKNAGWVGALLMVACTWAAAQGQPALPRPDLSRLSRVEHESIDLACANAKQEGLAALNRCLTVQMATYDSSYGAPNLSSLKRSERQAIEAACVGAKAIGPAGYNRCLRRQVPDLD